MLAVQTHLITRRSCSTQVHSASSLRELQRQQLLDLGPDAADHLLDTLVEFYQDLSRLGLSDFEIGAEKDEDGIYCLTVNAKGRDVGKIGSNFDIYRVIVKERPPARNLYERMAS